MITPNSRQHSMLIAKIEAHLQERHEVNDIKIGSKKGLSMEAEFLSGAMAALNAIQPAEIRDQLSPLCPPRWVFAAMSGRSIFK